MIRIYKGLYLVEDLENCENINYTLNGYYLAQDEYGINILKKCYKKCKTCNQGLIYDNFTQSYNQNCLECADNYYKIKNGKNANNCYGNEMILLNYTLENNLWKICHDNCFSCYGKPLFGENDTLVSQNCINCLDNYNIMLDTRDCYNDSIIDYGYYLNSVDSMYHKCNIQCKKCNQFNNCLICNNEQGYYIVEDKSSSQCYNSTNIGKGYILLDNLDMKTKNISNKIWIKCYSSCNSCFDSGNSIAHNCISCASKNYFIYNRILQIA